MLVQWEKYWWKWRLFIKSLYYEFIGKPYPCEDCGKYCSLHGITYVTDFGKLVCLDCLESNSIYLKDYST